MLATLHLDGRAEAGGSALIMHNERLSDPLDSFTRAIKEISSKRSKTEDDHAEIGHLEFLGSLYSYPMLEWGQDGLSAGHAGTVALPGWNIMRCLQDGGKRHKKGPDVLRGIHPLEEFCALVYEGPRDPAELWEAGEFSLRKGVGVSGRRVMRTRAIFTEWQASLKVEVDPKIFDLDTLRKCWVDAGKYCGIGDMRPIYGRFTATLTKGDA